MKTFLIFILAFALALAAFVTRPGKRELAFHLLDARVKAEALGKDAHWTAADLEQAERVLKSVKINDRILWVEVVKDDKVVYIGAFAHYIAKEQEDARVTAMADAAKLFRR